MNKIYIKCMRDVLNGHDRCEIINPYQGNVVRILTVEGERVRIDALIHNATVTLDTEVFFVPWMMDRGNLLFHAPDFGNNAKLCTEGDLVRYPDGTVACALPATARN